MTRFICLIYLLGFLLLVNCENATNPELSQETIVVLTFDDAYASIYENAYPIMREFGFRGTHYIPANFLGRPGFMTLAQVIEMEREGGWESAGHTLNHATLTQVSLEEAEAEIKGCQQFLDNHGLSHYSFATPGGMINQEITQIIKKYFQSNRNSENLTHKPPIDPYALGYFVATTQTSVNELKARILQGMANGEVMVIFGFHVISEDTNLNPGTIHPDDFRQLVQFLKHRNIRVLTISEALNSRQKE